MASFVKIASTDDFDGDGSRVITEVNGQEIAVFRHAGDYYAVANYCVHQSGPLCEGGLTGYMQMAEDNWDWEYDDEPKYISCPWHGWAYDITTGDNVKDSRYSVPVYDVKVEDGDVYVEI